MRTGDERREDTPHIRCEETPMNQAEQEIWDQQQRWMEAAARKDERVLNQILGEEYVLISARLGFVDRESWLGMGPDYNIDEFEYLESDIHLYGATAVSNSRYRQRATFKGEDLSLAFYLTDVWVNRDGRWQVVTRHSSIAPSI
jgi:hypothetical protein